MRRQLISSIILALVVIVALCELPTFAQSAMSGQKGTGSVKTDSRILYHNGPIRWGTQNVYIIWYGCWDNNCGIAGDTDTLFILSDFISNLGSTPYFQINSTYPDGSGQTPTGVLVFGGGEMDRFSHGMELTAADIQGIISDKIMAGRLPLDTSGIYLVLASGDVSSNATGFCSASAQPHHGYGTVLGTNFIYGFVGNPVRCPTIGAPQFLASDGTRLPTPNGNFGADGMASTMAHVLDGIVTNPMGSGWFDRYNLENADKCAGSFGQTYTTANGAKANIKLGYRDFLIQQNWVNDRRARCAMTPY